MLELGLLALGVYLLVQSGSSKPDNELPPRQRSTKQGTSQATTAQGRAFEKQNSDPWFWPVVPKIFTEVPLHPVARNAWINLREPYQDRAKIKAKLLTETDAEDKRDLRQDLRDIDKVIDQITANQRQRENVFYTNYLLPNFTKQEIDGFYNQRKQEIAQGIWPYNITRIVPAVEKKSNLDPTALAPDAGRETTIAITPMGARTFNTKDIERDAKLDAKLPGKRFTDGGGVYYEYRTNRSDLPGKAF